MARWRAVTKAVVAFAGTLLGAVVSATASTPHNSVAEISSGGWMAVAATVIGVTGGVYGARNEPLTSPAATPGAPPSTAS